MDLVEASKTLIPALIGVIAGMLLRPLSEVSLRWMLGPKLAMEFRDAFPFVTQTIERVEHSATLPVSGKNVPPATVVLSSNETDVKFVRVKVLNDKHRVAKNCRVYLTSIDSLDGGDFWEPTAYCDPFPLSWSYIGQSPMDIYRGLELFVDVIRTVRGNKRFFPQITSIPESSRDLFAHNGTFRFTLLAVADDSAPVWLRFTFEWHGDWDRFFVQHEGTYSEPPYVSYPMLEARRAAALERGDSQ